MGEQGKKEKMISSQEVADIIGKAPRTVQDLAKKGILTCQKKGNRSSYDLYTVVREYCGYVAQLNRKDFASVQEEKAHEEIRLKRAKADMAELMMQELRGRLHAAEDVEAMTTDLVMLVRSSLMALPGRVSAELAGTSDAAEVSEMLKREIYGILRDLSNYEYDPEEYRKRVREKRGWLMDGQDEG